MSVLEALAQLLPAVLLAAYPVLSQFQHNQSEVDPQVLWKALAIATAIATALFVMFKLAFKRGRRAGVLASLVVIAFFYFGIFSTDVFRGSLTDWSLFPIWMTLFACAAFAVIRTKRDLINVNRGLTVFAAVIVVIPVYDAVAYRLRHPPVRISDPHLWPTALHEPALKSGARRPDIYFIIPDDYARADVLKRYFRYDNSSFIHQLLVRGFVVADQCRSPYSKSELNMAAALNFDYLSRLPKIVGVDSQDVLLVRGMIDDSRASHVLEALGYRYVHIDSDDITFAADNPHISPLAAPDNLTYLWLRDSLLRLVGGRYGFDQAATDERFRRSVRSAFDRLDAVSSEPGPKFVLFHTLLPHDPYIFGAHGQDVTFPDQSDTGHSTPKGMKYYVEQLRYVNRKLLETTDAILAHSKAPPIIVLESDEGFEALSEDWGETAVRDMRVKGLCAFYLPGRATARVPRKLNTVNTFRLLLNQYFRTRYPLLQSASYPELDLPYQFVKMRVR